MKFKSPAIHRTPLYRAKAAYSNMLARCGNKDGKNPSYSKVKLKMTLEEWLIWAVPRYERFLAKYPKKRPNVARKGDKGHYEIGNIRIISSKRNRKESGTPAQALNGVKRCNKCKCYKTVNLFYKNRSAPDGFAHQCIDCRKEYAKNRGA